MNKKDEEKLQAVAIQLRAVIDSGAITCRCGRKREVRWFYRCLYCGEWFCYLCAESHFGKTVKEHRQEELLKR